MFFAHLGPVEPLHKDVTHEPSIWCEVDLGSESRQVASDSLARETSQSYLRQATCFSSLEFIRRSSADPQDNHSRQDPQKPRIFPPVIIFTSEPIRNQAILQRIDRDLVCH